MLKVVSDIREKAKKQINKIVLPEAEDLRVLEAAARIKEEFLADLILIGDEKIIGSTCKEKKWDIKDAEIIDPKSSKQLDSFADKLYQLRKHKGMTEDDARKLMIEKPVYFGAMLVREKKADGFVAGAVHTTRDVARASLYCIGLDPKIGTMSSSFVMITEDTSFGEKGVLIFADCAIVPDPSPKQLANIALSASDLMQYFFQATPRVAMLSFSTKGSGTSPEAEKVLKAIQMVKELRPGLLIDGELQADAALVPSVAERKAPKSPIGGNANVLIFPNLAAGNIAYKLTQRLAKMRALGPLLHGILAPCSDLSRGCGVETIIDVTCLTSIRCARNKTKANV
ncbi:MAG: phosphate acetyltransferase [Candidatus Omnitrophota bacterium]